MTNSKLQLSANDNCDGENHHPSDGFSVEFDYVDVTGQSIPMIGLPKVSEDGKMSPLEAMGSNFAKAIYEMGWGEGYSHAKLDAAGYVDGFLKDYFANDPRLKEIREQAYSHVMDLGMKEEVIWVNGRPEMKK